MKIAGRSYIGTMGFVFDCLTEMNFFYPPTLETKDFLKYYASQFNSVTLRGFDETLPEEWYFYIMEQVSDNTNFKFIMQLPYQFTNVGIKYGNQLWEKFWKGCNILHEKGKLGCIVVLSDTKFICNEKNIKRLGKICKKIPSDVNVAFDFMHWTWWESKEAEEMFNKNQNWVLSTPFLENGIVGAGWAGTIPSTRIRSRKNLVPISVSGSELPFVYIVLYGTLGKAIGSYDEYRFLEELAVKIRTLESEGVDVFVTFNNTNSSYACPLPPLLVAGYLCHPHLNTIRGVDIDMPCCLHDISKLYKVLNIQRQSKYKIDVNGYVQIKIKT
jgi:uncharacterized protein YecE (DUF72 family)